MSSPGTLRATPGTYNRLPQYPPRAAAPRRPEFSLFIQCRHDGFGGRPWAAPAPLRATPGTYKSLPFHISHPQRADPAQELIFYVIATRRSRGSLRFGLRASGAELRAAAFGFRFFSVIGLRLSVIGDRASGFGLRAYGTACSSSGRVVARAAPALFCPPVCRPSDRTILVRRRQKRCRARMRVAPPPPPHATLSVHAQHPQFPASKRHHAFGAGLVGEGRRRCRTFGVGAPLANLCFCACVCVCVYNACVLVCVLPKISCAHPIPNAHV